MASSPRKIPGQPADRYVSPRKKRGRPRGQNQLPMTPMIDVTFQLIIFFMVTFTFRQAEGLIPGTLPQGQTVQASVTDQPSITIRIRPAAGAGKAVAAVYELRGENRQIHEADSLYRALVGRRQLTGSDNTPVVIEPRSDVPWEHVVNAFNQAVRAKFKKIGFTTAG